MLPTGMDWIKTLDPLKQGVKQDEIDIAVQKLSLVRALGPKAITGDIANLMSQVINASGGNVRRTIVLTFPLLVDKLLEFVDHWAVKITGAMASSPAKDDHHNPSHNHGPSKPSQSVGSFQIIQSDWQDYDDVERERMIPILQTELKSLRELYQERVDEINAFEQRISEKDEQFKQELRLLQRQMATMHEECEQLKRANKQHQQQQQLEVASTASDVTSLASFNQHPHHHSSAFDPNDTAHSQGPSAAEESTELIEQREAIQQLQQDIQGLHAEIRHLLKEKDLLVQSSTQLEEELHGTIMAKEKLTVQVNDYKRQCEQIPQLETMLTMSNQQKSQMETNWKKTETLLKNQEKIVETLAKNLQKKEKELQRVVKELENTTQILQRTEEAFNTLSNQHVALESSAQGLHRSVEELQECKELLTAKQDELQRKVFELETDIVKNRVDNQNLQDDLVSMTNEKDMLLMALETSHIKLREKIEEVEALQAHQKSSSTTINSTTLHSSMISAPAAAIQQGIVGGVGNIVDYFEARTNNNNNNAGHVSPVPFNNNHNSSSSNINHNYNNNNNSMNNSSNYNHNNSSFNNNASGNSGNNAGKPAFPLLKRLSTGISSFTQGPATQQHQQHQQQQNNANFNNNNSNNDDIYSYNSHSESDTYNSTNYSTNTANYSGNYNNNVVHQPFASYAQPSSAAAGAAPGGGKSHALAASIRSKYAANTNTNTNTSNNREDNSSNNNNNNEIDDDPNYYAPVPSTRDVDSDDEA